MSEELGFQVLHGIVDSLWVKKPDAAMPDYMQLKAAIEQATG